MDSRDVSSSTALRNGSWTRPRANAIASQLGTSTLRPGGCFVFETRDPARRAWKAWNPDTSRRITDIDAVGPVEEWHEVLEVNGPLVTFRSTNVFHSDGEVLTSHSTLRFRERAEVEEDLVRCGYDVLEVRDAPDRPGLEFVFIARRTA